MPGQQCPNCQQSTELTHDFVGMISCMMPRESWVAKWNELTHLIPGVYAINVPFMNEEENEVQSMRAGKTRTAAIEEDDGLGDFIADDDEVE